MLASLKIASLCYISTPGDFIAKDKLNGPSLNENPVRRNLLTIIRHISFIPLFMKFFRILFVGLKGFCSQSVQREGYISLMKQHQYIIFLTIFNTE